MDGVSVASGSGLDVCRMSGALGKRVGERNLHGMSAKSALGTRRTIVRSSKAGAGMGADTSNYPVSVDNPEARSMVIQNVASGEQAEW